MATTDKTLVTLSDGRQVSFGKRERVKFENLFESKDSPIPIGLEVQFRHGKFIQIYLSECIEHAQLELRGLREKVQNEGSKDEVLTAEDMYKVASAMHERLKNGTAFDRATGPRGPRLDPVTIEAMVLVQVEAGSTEVNGAADPNLATLRASVVSILLGMTEEERKSLPNIEEFAQFFEWARQGEQRNVPVDVKTSAMSKFKLAKSE